MEHASGEMVKVTANPVRLSATPPTYRSAPPTLGQHNDEVLGGLLSLSPSEITELRGKGII
jgi:crotonobetainyl-CoA:carnitine CoA-transferase CaiB-like acyl-CoA transferase